MHGVTHIKKKNYVKFVMNKAEVHQLSFHVYSFFPYNYNQRLI
jgi:hypothetical protein